MFNKQESTYSLRYYIRILDVWKPSLSQEICHKYHSSTSKERYLLSALFTTVFNIGSTKHESIHLKRRLHIIRPFAIVANASGQVMTAESLALFGLKSISMTMKEQRVSRRVPMKYLQRCSQRDSSDNGGMTLDGTSPSPLKVTERKRRRAGYQWGSRHSRQDSDSGNMVADELLRARTDLPGRRAWKFSRS